MAIIGAYEAKTHLPQLLERVARGETFTITKHGVPIATLQPATVTKRTPVREIIEQLRQLKRENRLEGLSIKDLIAEGRL